MERAFVNATVQVERSPRADTPVRPRVRRAEGLTTNHLLLPPLISAGHTENLVQLQRLAGNRAVVRLLQDSRPMTRSRTGGQPRVQAPPQLAVQTKRTARPLDDLHLKKLDQKLVGVEGALGSAERLDRVWNALNALYNTYAGKGSVLWNGLQAQQRLYQRDPRGVANSMQEIRAEYQRRYRHHYLTAVRQTEKSGVRKVETSGFVEDRPDAPDANVYLSNIDVDRRIINVIRAYATKDLARIRDVEAGERRLPYERIGLQHSEILWQQLVDTAREHFTGRDKRAQDLLGKIAGITVHQASNMITQQVVFMAYPNGSFWDTDDHEWRAGTEEFNAILATPNVSMAAHMLKDHIDEVGGRSIESIGARAGAKDHYLDIKFTQPPLSSEKMLLIAVVMAMLLAFVFLR